VLRPQSEKILFQYFNFTSGTVISSLLYNGYRVFHGVKRLGLGVDHPTYLVSRLKKEYSHTSTPPLGLRGLF